MKNMVDVRCSKCGTKFGFCDEPETSQHCPTCGTVWERKEFDQALADIRRWQSQCREASEVRKLANGGSLVPLATELGVDRMKLRALIVGESALDDADLAKVRAWMARRPR